MDALKSAMYQRIQHQRTRRATGGHVGTTFGLLGNVSIVTDDLEVLIEPVMVRSLLVVLLLSANQFLSLDRIIGRMWDTPPKSVRANLRKYATDLRRVLHGVDAGLTDRVESRRDRGYRLLADRGEIDVNAFMDLGR